MCCMRLADNTGHKNYAKNRHLCTIAQLCRAISSQLRHLSTIGKILLNGNISSICPHNMLNFGPLTAEICWRVWGTPANLNGFRVLASLLHRRRSADFNQTLHDVWPPPALAYYSLYTFSEALAQLQNSLCVQVLRSPILAALLHGTPAVGVRQSLWRGTRNGITELSQRTPHIFDRAAITLGVGPHSSCFYFSFFITLHFAD